MRTFLSSPGAVRLVAGLCLLLSGRDAVAGTALSFDGVDDYVTIGSGLFPTVTNTFTIEVWANPTASRASTPEAVTGISGIGGQRYAIFPDYGRQAYGSDAHAGAGISIGTNGVSVFELTGDYLPSPLVFTNSLAGWTHFAVTYSNGLPRLYVGGNLVRTGLVSGLLVHPSANLGELGYGYGYYQGTLDEVRVWNVALDETTLQSWLSQEVNSNHPAYGNLIGYWRLNEGRDTNSMDSSTWGHFATLLNGTAWTTPGAPISGLDDPIVITDPASELADTSALLAGTVNPQGNATTAWFEWGPSTNFAFATPPQAVGTVVAALEVSNVITSLAPLSTYYFRIAASNSVGLSRGVRRQFKTFGPPGIVTWTASNVTAGSVILQGNVIPNGYATSAWFEWGMTTNYGTSTPLQSAGSGLESLVLTQTLAGLLGGEAYHYRIVATNASGPAAGLDQWFATPWLSNTFVLQPFRGGGVYWGDFDNSGRLDLLGLPNGTTSSPPVLWLNCTNTFVPQITALPFGGPGVGVVGDLNNDGLCDLVWSADYSFQGFLNDGAGFPISRPSLLNVYHGMHSGALGDFDNDGDLDLVMTGQDWGGSSYVPVTGLYRNDGGQFTALATTLPPVLNGTVAWGDYDNDGQLDILLAGETSTGRVAQIYHNNSGVFTNIGAGLRGVSYSSAAWGDYDGDGWLDVLLCGTTNGSTDGAIALIYHNNHDGTFTDIGADLPGALRGSAAWGDFDHDGQLDVLLVGVPLGYGDYGPHTAVVYRNDRGRFTDAGAGFPQYPFGYQTRGAGAWGDYDSDGKLDVAFSIGSYWDSTSGTPRVYRNWLATTNTIPNPPSAPSGLVPSIQNNGVTLRWHAASDPHTPTPGLTYNVRVGTTPGGSQILSPSSDPVTGHRYLPQMGNAQLRRFSTLTNLPFGPIYWSVQTVNNTFAGSPWALEQTFTVTSGPPIVVSLPVSNVLCCSALLNGFVTPGSLATRVWFEWGTNGSFGNATTPLDLGNGLQPQLVTQALPGLQPNTTYTFRLAATNSAGLALSTNQSLTTEGPAPVAATLTSSNVLYTVAALFGTSPLSSPAADYFIEWGTTAAYGQIAPAAIIDAALRFDGLDDCVTMGWGKFPNVTNNFTMELWVNPTAARAVAVESVGGYVGAYDQRYAMFPDQGNVAYGAGNHAGAGLSVGTNGVNVSESADNYIPVVLVYTNGVSGWTHLALVYSNNVPKLFVNATLVRTGLISSRVVHPSAGLGGVADQPWKYFGPFAGEIQDVRIWDVPLDAPTLQAWMNQSVTTNHPAYSHLQGYWPLNEGGGSTVTDLSSRHNPGQLLNGANWTGGRHSNARVFSAVLDGLAPGTTYHFRAVAINRGGTAYGADQTFTTLPRPRVLGVTVQAAPANPGSLLRFSGSPGLGYVLDASTNLVGWLPLTNLVAGSDGLFEFLDTSATNFPIRFYRLRVP